MPTQTELEFYKAFGIEPDHYETCMLECKPNATLEDFKNSGCDKKDTCPHNKIEDYYPEITDRRLLELICVHLQYLGDNFASLELDNFKEEILDDLASEQNLRAYNDDYSSDLYDDVRKIMGVE